MSTGHAATLQAVAAACQDPRLAALAEAVGAGTLTLPKAAAGGSADGDRRRPGALLVDGLAHLLSDAHGLLDQRLDDL